MQDFSKKPFNLDAEGQKWVADTLAGMSTVDKVRQLFCLIAYNSDEEYIRKMATDVKAGGVMFRKMPGAEVAATARMLQDASQIPMLIAANLEAGADGICLEATRVGCGMGVAATGDVDMGRKMGEVAGSESSVLGCNWAFAPIIDIDYNFRNPITNTRTFGSNVKLVGDLGEAYVKAVQKYDVAASIKHFPGDGCDERDQHLVTSINDVSCEEWDATFGKLYRQSIEAGAMTVMVGHIMQPAYSRALSPGIKDEDILPASLAPELLNGLLREKLGFNGLIVTDASTMAGMVIPMSREKLVPHSIAAGCDMFLFTKNLDEDIAFMQKGVDDGVITPERLDEAVTRILALKAALKLHTKKKEGKLVGTDEEIAKVVGSAEHKAWAVECADKGITLVKEEKGVIPLSADKYKRVLLYVIETGGQSMAYGVAGGAGDRVKTALEQRGYEVTIFKPVEGFEGLLGSAKDIEDNYDLILYVANMATKSNQTTVRIEWMEPMGCNVPIFMTTVPTIFVSLENPYHLLDVPRVRTFINTYGSSAMIVEQLLDKLEGKSTFKGVSPVDAFCGKWDTRL